jgi:hypothetical protein
LGNGNGGDEFAGRADRKISLAPFGLTVGHLRLIDDRGGGVIEGNLARGAGVSQDVPGHGGLASLIVTGQSHAVVDGKAGGVPPIQEVRNKPDVDQPFPFEHLKQVGQGLDINALWHAVTDTSLVKETIGCEGMDVGLSSGSAGVGRGAGGRRQTAGAARDRGCLSAGSPVGREFQGGSALLSELWHKKSLVNA